MLIDPVAGFLLPDVLDWCESVASTFVVMEHDGPLRSALAERGCIPVGGPFFQRHTHDLTGLTDPVLPPGFHIEDMTGGDAERRAAVHRAGWVDFDSQLSADTYRRLMAARPYRVTTDLVVVAPDGEWVASALGWYDDANRVGLVEPVSCVPAWRGRGLATAVNVALLHAFVRCGAGGAVVLPRGDAAYPVPARLYRAVGYRPGSRTTRFCRVELGDQVADQADAGGHVLVGDAADLL